MRISANVLADRALSDSVAGLVAIDARVDPTQSLQFAMGTALLIPNGGDHEHPWRATGILRLQFGPISSTITIYRCEGERNEALSTTRLPFTLPLKTGARVVRA